MPAVDRLFAHFNLVLLDDEATVVAGGWGVPLAWDGSVDGLPDGWDGALERAVSEHDSERSPDTLCAMATEVVSEHRGHGLSAQVLMALREQAKERGLRRMIAPARPILKHRYPLTPIERYARWTREDGSPFDPWIRTHWRLGARILATTPEAMKIVAPVA